MTEVVSSATLRRLIHGTDNDLERQLDPDGNHVLMMHALDSNDASVHSVWLCKFTDQDEPQRQRITTPLAKWNQERGSFVNL